MNIKIVLLNKDMFEYMYSGYISYLKGNPRGFPEIKK